MIELIDLNKKFGNLVIFKDLRFTIPSGRITSVLGRSGGGKSVLLKHIIGLLKPDSGRILVDGQDIVTMNDHHLNDIRRRFGMLFQEAALFDSMNVGENVAFPLREHTDLTEEEIQERVQEKLGQVGLPGIEDKMPSELSGGMRKRVGLARAIALDPEIILFDEPTTGLDPITSSVINHLIADTQRRLNATCVIISHDIEAVFAISDRVAMLYEGKIEAEGGVEEMRTSDNPVVRQFISGSFEGPIIPA
ncbi:MAG: ABC transporter ATP-binding protein [Pseudomonadota bacterium]